MLSELSINNFAVVSKATLALDAGMTVISGETGAGKSLLVDALLLLAGQRADSGVVRHGSDRAEVAAEFSTNGLAAVTRWLQDAELDEPDSQSLQVRRVVRADGGSKAWINGRPVTVGQLSELMAHLVEIHGQHEQQALLSRPAQLRLLDAFAKHPKLLTDVRARAAQWRTLQDRREALMAQGDVADRVAYLQHQLDELSREQLDPAFIAQLLTDHRRLSNADAMRERLERHIAELNGNDEIPGALGTVQKMASDLSRFAEDDIEIGQVASLLTDADTAMSEALHSLERVLDSLNMDPSMYSEMDERLGRLHELGRKHRVELDQLDDRQVALGVELESLRNARLELETIDSQIETARDSYSVAAESLRQSRARAAKTLSQSVTATMQELGMEGGRFSIELETVELRPDSSGLDRAEFQVAANKGQPARALRKVASGGELSRISLAIEVVTIGLDPVPTMIFDEVDSGIGGAVADAVGKRLRKLSESADRQVLCVTHLPQVASQGHTHFQVSKFAKAGLTQSAVTALDDTARIEEIARMLGGATVTPQAREAAKALLESR